MPPARIFISYRRSGDAPGYAGRLHEALQRYFDAASVFIDVHGIEAGDEFGQDLTDALASCVVFLPVIGRQWLTVVGADGHRRLDNPADWVRREAQTALDRRITIIPVLVDGASMPDAPSLPEPLQLLVQRQALEVTESRWDYDVTRLINAVEKALGVPWWRRLTRMLLRRETGLVRALRGIVVMLAAATGVLLWYESTFPNMAPNGALYSIALAIGLCIALLLDWLLRRLAPHASPL